MLVIAGKNQCAIDVYKYLKRHYPQHELMGIPNSDDDVNDSWQPSFKKYLLKNYYGVGSLEDCYDKEDVIFFSVEFDKIIKTEKFKSKKLFNFHFSLLPKYRGCHTNFFQLYNGERYSGVTLHEIDNSIDGGPIISQMKYKIRRNHTAQENYVRLMNTAVELFKRKIEDIIDNNYKSTPQDDRLAGKYYDRKSADYKSLRDFKIEKYDLETHNKLRALIFPAFQHPVVDGKEVKRSLYKNGKFICEYV
jgi:methionyl-tRNA formyltransferase